MVMRFRIRNTEIFRKSSNVQGAHLVGSAPFKKSEEMFRIAGKHVGSHIARLGDGEVGERDTWIRFQNKRLAQSPQLAPGPPVTTPDGRAGQTTYHIREEVKGSEIELPDLGYAVAALESYRTFEELKQNGEIPPHVRFMVGLPTPLSVVSIYVDLASRERVFAAHEKALMGEIKRVVDGIPHDQLSIQFEMVLELMMLEGVKDHYSNDPRADMTDQFKRLCLSVPDDVELGWHLCYGDSGHKHFVEPKDTSHLVWVANTLTKVCARPFNYLHIPVPRDRNDDAYFQPLTGLELRSETKLYLGLIHMTGGEEGTNQRIATASKYVADFGIATECGFGRRPAEQIPTLLHMHSTLAKPLI